MDGADGGDVVYASILARVEKSELRGQCLEVVRKENRSVGRHVRKASASLTALRQLQAAATHLRPSGDWLVGRLETQLKSVEELQSRLETAVEQLEKDARKRKTKKRKRPVEKRMTSQKVDRSREDDKTRTYRDDGDSEEEVEFLQVVAPADRRKESESVKDEVQERNEGGQDVVAEKADGHEQDVEVEAASVKERIQTDEGAVGCVEEETQMDVDEEQTAVTDREELPNGLVRTLCDSTVRVKEEVVTAVGQAQIEESGRVAALDLPLESDGDESPIELAVFESSEESAVEVDASDAEEEAMELQVPDSESDDDFSPCVEMTTKLSKARTAVRLAEFPVVVEQLRSYLLQCKHLTATDLDGQYLFAHKRITSEEAEEIGRAFRTVVNVGISLPRRPRTKLALHDLLDTIENLELTLGSLPDVLRPSVKKLSDYISMHVDERTRSRDKRLAELKCN